ncbi:MULTISPECIES: hypothetical protein [Rhizobium]|uniref:hypothetical protein n=1 Tax=Rhizobium TaxID=379 RepID=UPI0013EED74D|nr:MULTISPECIES: hypothetical protein [Rhizobium]MDV4156694.1 hypothetical protein [Rhizobium brockwellii]NZD53174.1 hypothetical protein [Rhizobium leguminosarum]QJX08514.1 hypothetical protein RLCC275e_26495 [Rhizobium brockwellii]
MSSALRSPARWKDVVVSSKPAQEQGSGEPLALLKPFAIPGNSRQSIDRNGGALEIHQRKNHLTRDFCKMGIFDDDSRRAAA